METDLNQLNEKRISLREASIAMKKKIEAKSEKLKLIERDLMAYQTKLQDITRKFPKMLTIAEKLQHKHVILKEYNDFLTDTERNQDKINESVFTLLCVVKKESEILRRKKESTSA